MSYFFEKDQKTKKTQIKPSKIQTRLQITQKPRKSKKAKQHSLKKRLPITKSTPQISSFFASKVSRIEGGPPLNPSSPSTQESKFLQNFKCVDDLQNAKKWQKLHSFKNTAFQARSKTKAINQTPGPGAYISQKQLSTFKKAEEKHIISSTNKIAENIIDKKHLIKPAHDLYSGSEQFQRRSIGPGSYEVLENNRINRNNGIHGMLNSEHMEPLNMRRPFLTSAIRFSHSTASSSAVNKNVRASAQLGAVSKLPFSQKMAPINVYLTYLNTKSVCFFLSFYWSLLSFFI